MKKNLYFNPETIVAFQITGGGGNHRKLTYLGEHKIGDFTSDLLSPTDEEGNPTEGEYTDGAGNPVELTTEQVRTGIGTINLDGDFDTVYTLKMSDINYTDEEAKAIINDCYYYEKDYAIMYFLQGQSRINAEAILDELNESKDYYIIAKILGICSIHTQIEITSREDADDHYQGAELIRFEFDGSSCVAILYPEGNLAVPEDWQNPIWDNDDWTIEDTKWVESNC